MFFYILGFFDQWQFDLGHFKDVDCAKATAMDACNPYGFAHVEVRRIDDEILYKYDCLHPADLNDMKVSDDTLPFSEGDN